MRRKEWCAKIGMMGLLLVSVLPLHAQDSGTRTADAATAQAGTPSVVPQLPTFTPTFTPAPPTTEPTATPTIPPTPTPQIEGELIVDTGAIIYFPNAIEFFLITGELLETNDPVQLEISAETMSEPVIVEGVATDFREEDDSLRLSYRWQIDPKNAPTLFDVVNYRWSVEHDGETGTASSELIFTDPRAIWMRNETTDGNIVIVTPDRNRARLVTQLEQVYRLLETQTGETPQFQFIVYSNGVLPPCADGAERCNSGPYAEVYERSGYTPVVDSDALLLDLIRSLAKSFYEPAWNGSNVPEWWVEGLSRYLSPTAFTPALVTSQTAERAGETFSLQEMATRPSDAAQQAQWAAQAYGMVLYTLNTVGRDGLFALANMPESSFAESFQAVTGQSLTTLVPGWSRWIFTEGASVVYGLTPYLPDTATPSITPTPSSTRTPLPTASYTPTITSTPSPDLRNATDPPTITPLPSATDSPPTATPRSMDVLLTPQPQQTDASSVVSADVRLIAVTILLAIIGVLVAIFLLTLRRK